MTDSVFARAKDRVSIADALRGTGVKLIRAGDGWRSWCPVCLAGQKSKKQPFSVGPGLASFRCWACDERGDVVELERLMNGGTPIEAAYRLLHEDRPAPAPRPEKIRVHVPDGPSFTETLAANVWREGIPARNTLGQRYLVNRGIGGRVLLNAVAMLRFHPHVYHSGPPHRPVHFPALIGQVTVPNSDGSPMPTGGIIAIYIGPDARKARVPEGKNYKQMFGPQSFEGIPGGVWLAPWDGEGDLVTGEGCETSLSLAMLHDGPSRPLAALSLDRLQGGWATDNRGCYDVKVPRPATGRPAMTWPSPPGAPIRRVLIGIDHDMGTIKKKVAGVGRFETAEAVIDASDRARICAALSAHWWQRAVPDASIEPLVAPRGQDWNDVLLETLSDQEA